MKAAEIRGGGVNFRPKPPPAAIEPVARDLQTKKHDGHPPTDDLQATDMKHFALAGISESDRSNLTRLLATAQASLEHAWAEHDGESTVDLVIADLSHFAGRVARVRALNERTSLAVLADAGAETLDAVLVLNRPLGLDGVIGVFNRASGGAGGAPVRSVMQEAAPAAARATFQAPRQPRVVTDFQALVARGPTLIERPGMARLLLDPANDAFHANAPLSRLEGYFLDPLKPTDCRQLSRSRLEELREMAPGRPLVQLHWMGALLRSNGCLGAHLDPGGTYRVQRWLSVYGEYRKQYRIATQMLRPARLHEIARKADASMVEVFDVVNAYDTIGLLEWQPRASRHAALQKKAEDGPRKPAADKRRMLAAALLSR